MKLVLVRHGESIWNRENRFTGWTDVELSHKGKNDEIRTQMESGKKVLITAHGNSLRALVKYLDHLSDGEVVHINIPTGIPLVYEFNESFEVIKKYYLGDEESINARIQSAANPDRTK